MIVCLILLSACPSCKAVVDLSSTSGSETGTWMHEDQQRYGLFLSLVKASLAKHISWDSHVQKA
jgi:hypothetical protein